MVFTVGTNAQPVKNYGHLKVVGTQLLDKHNNPIALHGMSFGWHNYWPRFYTAGVVKTLYQDWNCTVVRAAMGVDPRNGYFQDSAGSVNSIKTVVEAAIKEGIYVIIDWHSFKLYREEAKTFFKNMALAYGKYPNIIYELINEPDKESWSEVKAYAEEIIKLIRAIDPENLILVGCPHWDQDIQLPADDPIKGIKNIMYTVHFYAATHKQWLRDRVESSLKKGLPVFISESAGMEASGDGPINYDEWQKWIDFIDLHGLSWLTWSVSDKDETCSVLKKSASSNGNWTDSDLKESGIKTKDYLKNYDKNLPQRHKGTNGH